MILSRKLSWMLEDIESSMGDGPDGHDLAGLRYVYVQDVIDLQTRRFFVSDGRYFIACSVSEDAFTRAMYGYDADSIRLKGSILLIMQYRFFRNANSMIEITVSDMWYTGEGSLAGDSIDVNDALCGKRLEAQAQAIESVGMLLRKHANAEMPVVLSQAGTMALNKKIDYSIDFDQLKLFIQPEIYDYLTCTFRETYDTPSIDMNVSDPESCESFIQFKHRLFDKINHLLPNAVISNDSGTNNNSHEEQSGSSEGVELLNASALPIVVNTAARIGPLAANSLPRRDLFAALKEIPLHQALNISQTSSKHTLSSSINTVHLWSSTDVPEIPGACPDAELREGGCTNTCDADNSIANSVDKILESMFDCNSRVFSYPELINNLMPKESELTAEVKTSTIHPCNVIQYDILRSIDSRPPIKNRVHSLTIKSKEAIKTSCGDSKAADTACPTNLRKMDKKKKKLVIKLPGAKTVLQRVYIMDGFYMLASIAKTQPGQGCKNTHIAPHLNPTVRHGATPPTSPSSSFYLMENVTEEQQTIDSLKSDQAKYVLHQCSDGDIIFEPADPLHSVSHTTIDVHNAFFMNSLACEYRVNFVNDKKHTFRRARSSYIKKSKWTTQNIPSLPNLDCMEDAINFQISKGLKQLRRYHMIYEV